MVRYRYFFAIYFVVANLFSISLLSTSTEFSESLAEYLIRYRIFAMNRDAREVTLDERGVRNNRDALSKLKKHIANLGAISPLCIQVIYKDPYKAVVGEFTWPVTCPNSDENYQDVVSVEDYLERAKQEINQLLANGYLAKTLTFQETQALPFVKKTSLAGDDLNISGVTPEIERLIIAELTQFLTRAQIKTLAIYFFGSRVMPRSEVIKRDPSFLNILPVNENGLMKNTVRIGGLTKISDLEIAVVFSSPFQLSKDNLKKIKNLFSAELIKIFRDFPIGLKLFQYHETTPQNDYFDFINRSSITTYNRPLSRYQFVRVYKDSRLNQIDLVS